MSKDDLKAYRWQRYQLLALSIGLDLAVTFIGIPVWLSFWGLPLLGEETLEYLISLLLARGKMKIKTRYRIAGFIPIPGVTALSLQAGWELWRSYRDPDRIRKRLEKDQIKSTSSL